MPITCNANTFPDPLPLSGGSGNETGLNPQYSVRKEGEKANVFTELNAFQ